MANGTELKNYRTKIMTALINDPMICSLLLNRTITDTDDADMQEELLNGHIFSYSFVPSVQDEQKSYITFEISSKKAKKFETRKGMRLVFSVFSHHAIIRDKRTNYLKTDLLDERIQHLFNENKDFGIGNMYCIEDNPLRFTDSHYGRQLVFVVSEIAVSRCD